MIYYRERLRKLEEVVAWAKLKGFTWVGPDEVDEDWKKIVQQKIKSIPLIFNGAKPKNSDFMRPLYTS